MATTPSSELEPDEEEMLEPPPAEVLDELKELLGFNPFANADADSAVEPPEDAGPPDAPEEEAEASEAPRRPAVRVDSAPVRAEGNELDIARGIAAGLLTSPQQYENLWLFAMRVTGTGISYRPELDEYVWREPDIYLTPEFLARCNGLPVIIQHPEEEQLTSEQFARRVIGALLLPYIDGDEVWAVARIYDEDAARLMQTHQLSTSPAVKLPASESEVRKLVGGKHLLIEGAPSLLDHLAICELGVWDKGGEPTGIAIGEPEMAEPMTEADIPAEARADAAWPWLAEVERLIGPIH
jgi:hypothetical protein